MSIARQLFREFRPLFRMLEEPLGRPSAILPANSLFNDPFLRLRSPAVDVTEEDGRYIVEAEIPGVPKENVEVRIGDDARSVTIAGKIVNRRRTPATVIGTKFNEIQAADDTREASSQLPVQSTSERAEPMAESSSTFSRTVWLPEPVDSEKVSAKLSDGILTIVVNKAEGSASTVVPIE